MTDRQKKVYDTFTESFPKREAIHWYYDYEDAVFRSQFGDENVRYFVKYSDMPDKEIELFKMKSNVLMDSISDLDKVLITKSDYDNFPKQRTFKHQQRTRL